MQNLPQLQLTEPQQLLCDVIQVGDPEKSRHAVAKLRQLMGNDAAFEFAQRHEVACMAGHHFLDSGKDCDQAWIKAHADITSQMTAYMQELDEVAELFDTNNIPVIALKNGGIARGLHDCLGCCPMGDLDLLVQSGDFAKAHRLLVDRDYGFEFRHEGLDADFEAAFRSGSTEYWKTLSSGDKLWVDFQCRPVAGKWIRPDQEPSAEELMDRAHEIERTKVRVLSPEDNLLQVALHTAKHSYIRDPGLRLHTDVDRIIASQPIDWSLFLKRVRDCDALTPVYFSLAMASDLLGTAIPTEILQELQPAGWKRHLIARWINNAGIFEPAERKFSRLGYICFTALQYDNAKGLARAVFPSSEWMRDQFPEGGALPILYMKRLRKLLWRRFSA